MTRVVAQPGAGRCGDWVWDREQWIFVGEDDCPLSRLAAGLGLVGAGALALLFGWRRGTS